jgi:hypothetical protein
MLTDGDGFEAYMDEARRHPDEEDLSNARAFAREVFAAC